MRLHMPCHGMKFLNKGFIINKIYRKINHIRQISSYFVTTPIFYVNASPHIGHLYTCVLADAIARFQIMKNPNVDLKFMTGTDEHGLKVSIGAGVNGMTEQLFCDTISQKYRNLFHYFDVSFTDFLRTTEDRHKNTVRKLWNLILDRGYIYLGEYNGWYCTSDESFISEANLQPEYVDGNRYTLDSNKLVHFISEKNYKFKLSHFQNDLLHWLKSGSIVTPKKFQKELEGWILNEQIMQDLSVSRPASRVKWGIHVPNDPSQTIYVWLDALSSYLTSSRYPESAVHWPPDLHVIGKDILRFHGIYWPAFLIAAGLEPPKKIFCHSHWLNDGEKMSKSSGNVIDPMEKANLYTNEGFRYFLLLTGVPQSDGNYQESNITSTVNADLVNKLGNLLNRCCSKVINPDQVFPSYSPRNHSKYCSKNAELLIQSLEALPDSVYNHYENFEFYKGISDIREALGLANKYFQDETPWNLTDPSQKDQLRSIIHVVVETLRICGILLQPVVPRVADRLLCRLSVDQKHRSFENIRPFSWQSDDGDDRILGPSQGHLFRRIVMK